MTAQATQESVVRYVREMLKDYCRLDNKVQRDHARPVQGGYGDVYRGTYTNTTTPVCVKVFRHVDFSCIENDSISRLIHEIQVWSPLDHQNVVRFYGWILYESKNTERPTPSLVSSWCEGGNILTFLGVRRPTGDKRLLLIQGIAKGLDYLHSQSVVHGDIKPDNVVVDGNDVPRLCDFGTSSTNQPNRRILRQTHTMTLRYAAPELLMDEYPFRCAASDVWAFGCTAMQILRGEQPYHFVRNTGAVIRAVEVKRPPFEPRSSTPMEEILSGCLDYDPHRRPDIKTLLDKFGIPSEETLTPFPELVKLLLREPTGYWANEKDYRSDGDDDKDEIVRTSPHSVLRRGCKNRMDVRIKTLRKLPITAEWERRDFVRRFFAQGKNWNNFARTNLAPMQGWMMRLDDDGNLNVGLVSPWYPRGNVKSYLAEYPKADRNKLVFDIFCGLNYLHDAKTVHGNLKPTNILIKFDGTAVLCDYGLQTLLRDTGITFQSIRYTAPELRQNDGGAFQCSYEGDIWAFGCVSIEIMTDQRPYDTIDKETEILVTEIPAYTTDSLQPIDSAEIKSCLNAPPKERSSREVIQEWVDWQS